MSERKTVNTNNILAKNDLAYEEEGKENNHLPDNRRGKAAVNTITPPIDNEPFLYKRCYMFRESTLRMLNDIKAKHPDVGVYLNTIMDDAIRYYYKNFLENSENKG